MSSISYDANKLYETLKGKAKDEEVQKALDANEESVNKTARTVLQFSKTMTTGLSKISDEMERKRKTDEFYLLLDLIDSLEDKIIGLGGNLKEIYDNLDFNKKDPITITDSEILMLYKLLNEEQLKWLLNASKKDLVNPLKIFCQIFARYTIRFEDIWNGKNYNGHMVAYSIPSPIGDIALGIAKENKDNNETIWNFEPFGWLHKKRGEQERYFEIVNKKFKLKSSGSFMAYINDSDSKHIELKGELLSSIKRLFENITYLSEKQMENIDKFQVVISEINCDIILDNLRTLHSELLIIHKQLKMQ